MQKKLLALAVAGALVPAAAMAQSTVEIYGRANLGLDNYQAKGATAGADFDFKGRTRVFNQGSRLGFRVNEGLGGGMRAFVVIETGIRIDNGGQATDGTVAVDASTGTWASRDSYVGVGGGWGDVRFGRQSIYWSNGVIVQTAANYINQAADTLINSIGMLAVPTTRTSNVVSYNTPTFSGFNASLSYAPQSEGAAAGANTDAKIYGVTGRYTTGALRAQFDWAKNKGATATGVERTEIDGVKLGVGWAYAPGSQVSFVAERLKRENSAAIGNSALAGDDLKANVYLLNWEHMIGPWQLLAQYGWTSKVKGLTGADTGNTQVKGITLGGKYFLSKRTGVYVTYNKITNQSNAFADYGGGIGMTLVAANEGADPRVIAVGVMHNF